jgi:tetratricopeptide (TPR) repeat protein
MAVNTRTSSRLWMLVAAVLLGYCSVYVTADEPPQEHYAARVKLLVEAHERLFKEHQRIVDRKRELRAEFAEAQEAINTLQLAEVVNRLKAQRLTTRVNDAQLDLRTWLQTLEWNDATAYRSALNFAADLQVWRRELQLESERINNAGRVVIQHMLACIDQVVALAREDQELVTQYDKLQADYWALADVAGQRSREELEGGIRELKLISDDNPAAFMVRGVAHRRLGKFSAAQADFERIIRLGHPWQMVALAARGESLIAQGRTRQGMADINGAVKSAKDDPRVVLFQALGHAAAGKYTTSEKAWKRLLALGNYDAAAHRGLALIYSTSDEMRRRKNALAEALQHAETACEITGNSDWSCVVALAAAKAANEDFMEAEELAEKAANLALGDKRKLCLDCAERYQASEKPIWNWK